MSDSREVKCKLAEDYPESSCSSNELLSAFLSENTRKGAKCILQGHSSLSRDNIKKEEKEVRGREFVSALRNMVKLDSENCKKEMVSEEGIWVGAIVTKVFNGVRYIGKVMDYDVETGRFKVMYEDNHWEEVKKEDIIQLLAPQDLVRSYYNRAAGSSRKAYRRRKKPATGKKVSTSPKKKTDGSAKKASAAKTAATYIPLAFREKKKDAYYWY